MFGVSWCNWDANTLETLDLMILCGSICNLPRDGIKTMDAHESHLHLRDTSIGRRFVSCWIHKEDPAEKGEALRLTGDQMEKIKGEYSTVCHKSGSSKRIFYIPYIETF